jgi:hypothetical protein
MHISARPNCPLARSNSQRRCASLGADQRNRQHSVPIARIRTVLPGHALRPTSAVAQSFSMYISDHFAR